MEPQPIVHSIFNSTAFAWQHLILKHISWLWVALIFFLNGCFKSWSKPTKTPWLTHSHDGFRLGKAHWNTNMNSHTMNHPSYEQITNNGLLKHHYYPLLGSWLKSHLLVEVASWLAPATQNTVLFKSCDLTFVLNHTWLPFYQRASSLFPWSTYSSVVDFFFLV